MNKEVPWYRAQWMQKFEIGYLITPSATGDLFCMFTNHWNLSESRIFIQKIANKAPITTTFVSYGCRAVSCLWWCRQPRDEHVLPTGK